LKVRFGKMPIVQVAVIQSIFGSKTSRKKQFFRAFYPKN